MIESADKPQKSVIELEPSTSSTAISRDSKPHPCYPPRITVPDALPSAREGIADAFTLPIGPYRLLVSGSPERASAQLVAHLAKGAQEVIAADSGAQACREAGVVPDMVVGDLDSLTSDTVRWCEDVGVRQQTYPWEKDESDLKLALRAFDDEPVHQPSFLVVTSALGGRLDHLLSTIGALADVPSLAPVLVEDVCLALILDAQVGRRSIDLSCLGCVEYTTVSVIALGGDAHVCEQGLRWDDDDILLASLSDRGLSNYVADPVRARIEVRVGTVLVVIPRETHEESRA